MPLFSLFATLGTSPSLVVLVLNDFSGFSFVARDLSWPCSSSNQVIVKFGISSTLICCRCREVYQWPHKYNPRDDGLSNMEYWLPRGYNLPKCKGAEILKPPKTSLLQISTSRFRAALKNKDMPWKKILEDDPSLQGYLQVWVCCFLNTSETISSSGDSSPSPREFCSVQYWPVHGAKDRSGEELVFFNSTNSQYQN